MSDELISQIDERIEKSRESMIQTFNKLFLDHKEEVKQTIKETVNGKIDKMSQENRGFHKQQEEENQKKFEMLTMILEKLDSRIKPFEEGVSWFTRAKNGAGWVAGFLTAITLIWASLGWLINHIKP